MEMIKFFFRTGFVLILVGVALTLIFQFFFTWSDSAARTKDSTDGPAERMGEVLDRGIAGLGKLTERAGQEMQKATSEEPRREVVSASSSEKHTDPESSTSSHPEERSLRDLLNPSVGQ